MRITCIYFIVILSTTSMLLGGSLHGQGLDEKITIGMNHESLKALINKIKQTTSFTFGYRTGLLDSYPDISFPEGVRTVKETLDLAFANTPLRYQLMRTVIIVFDENEQPLQGNVTSANEVNANRLITVSGTVKDVSGEPLPGVNVVVKGSTLGTSTDSNGQFALEVPDDSEILVFSFIGYKSLEIALANQTVFNVVLEQDVTTLQEVQIMGGYYVTTDKTKTGSIVKVTARDIGQQPVTSPLMALQGRAAGVDVYPSSGIPGSGPKIKIRGENSLRFDGGYPLYVIDGVPVDSSPIESSSIIFAGEYDPLSAINPANIESIEILKDADATAVYGSRGANGVVLITTKRASEGRTSVDFNVYRGIGQLTQKMDLLNTQEYLEIRREAFRNNNNEAKTEFNAKDLLVWDTTRYTDWQKVLLGGTSDIIDLQTSVSGGNSTTSFRLGSGFHEEGTIFSGDFYFRRFTGNFTLNHLSRDNKFRATISANYGVNKNHFFDAPSPVTDALNLPPIAPALYREDGALNWEPNSLGGSTWINPMAGYKRTNDSKISNLIFNSTISYNVGWGVVLKTNLGYTDLNSSEVLKTPVSSYDPVDAPYLSPSSMFSSTSRGSWIIEPQIAVSRQFGDHGIEAIIGSTFQTGNSDYKRIQGTGYASDALLGSLQAAAVTDVISDNSSQYRYTSVFTRIGYDFKGKYLLSVTGRRDGSSRFGSDNRFGNFGSLGAGWVFSKEKFFPNALRFFSFGKLRASIGTVGNDQIGDYRYLNTFSVTGGTYVGTVGLVPTSLYNATYRWEITKKIEAGLEVSLFKNRISAEIAWYRNRSSNQLTDYQLPGTTGFGSILQNLDATVENRGLEYSLNFRLIGNNELKWITSVNYSRPENKLLKFSDIERSSYYNVYIVGQPLTVKKFYTYMGVDSESGLYTFLDVNTDGLINGNDRTLVKNVGRSYFGGINNTITYKGIEMSFMFQFVKQNVISYSPGAIPGRIGNIPQYIYDNRWKKSGDVTNIQKVHSGVLLFSQYVNNKNSDNNIESSSFLRLKTVSLSYNLPLGFMSKIKIQYCRVYFQGQNLVTFSDYRGLDPETESSTVPPLRQMVIGLQIGI